MGTMGLLNSSQKVIMKIILALFALFATASADDCTDCTAVVSTLGVYLTSDESISAQVDILLSEVCPTATNPEECVEGLPAFWTRVAMVLWEGGEWMCATEDICGAPESQ